MLSEETNFWISNVALPAWTFFPFFFLFLGFSRRYGCIPLHLFAPDMPS